MYVSCSQVNVKLLSKIILQIHTHTHTHRKRVDLLGAGVKKKGRKVISVGWRAAKKEDAEIREADRKM